MALPYAAYRCLIYGKDIERLGGAKKGDRLVIGGKCDNLSVAFSRPAAVFDPFPTLAALKQVMNVTHEKGDNRASKYLLF